MFALLSNDKNESYTPYSDPEDAIFELLQDFKTFINDCHIPAKYALPIVQVTAANADQFQTEADTTPSNSFDAKIRGSQGTFNLISILGKLLLTLGIFGAPYIFAWFTLKPGYSNRERILAFLWMFIVILVLMGSQR